MMTDEKKENAAFALAAGTTSAEAARRAGVDRSTITRWLRDSEFTALIAKAANGSEETGVAGEAQRSLSDLLPKAVDVIERALSGDKTLVSSARVALDVMKTAAQLAPKTGSGSDAPPLADLIRELDKRETHDK
jgi:transposase-like protein